MPTPTYTLIDSVTLGSSAASVTFSSIDQTYGDIVAVYAPISTSAAFGLIKINNDTSSIYSSVEAIGTGSTNQSFTDTNFSFCDSDNSPVDCCFI